MMIPIGGICICVLAFVVGSWTAVAITMDKARDRERYRVDEHGYCCPLDPMDCGLITDSNGLRCKHWDAMRADERLGYFLVYFFWFGISIPMIGWIFFAFAAKGEGNG